MVRRDTGCRWGRRGIFEGKRRFGNGDIGNSRRKRGHFEGTEEIFDGAGTTGGDYR